MDNGWLLNSQVKVYNDFLIYSFYRIRKCLKWIYVNLNVRCFISIYACAKVSIILILITNMILIEFISGSHDGLSYQVVAMCYTFFF